MHVEQPQDEAPLVRRAQQGDVAAFELLYRRSVDRVYSLCLRMSADPALADELCQATFVKAWTQLPSFTGAASLASWLHRIAVNTSRMHHRGEGRREARVLALPTPEPAPRCDGSRMDLERAIAALPDGARRVFVLHDVEGFRHAEVAEALGITVGTSKGQLHRARRLLREELHHAV